MAFKRPSIPSLSARTPSDIRRAITSIVDYLTGMGKQQELVDESIKRLAGDLKEVGVFPGQPAPTGLVVTGAFNTIILQWDQSKTSGFSHTEVWRSPEDNLSNAQPVGSTSAYVFGDTPPDSSLSKTYYYWIRYVNQAGQPGPYNDTAGTPGKTADDPAYVLEVLTDEITEGQLYEGLNERIDKIEVNETAISEEITTRQSKDEALAQSIQTVSAVADGNTSAIQTEQTARINGDDALASNISALQVEVDGVSSSLQTKAEVSDLNAVYEVKTDINGRVTGFGMVADATSTEFGINADRFWVVDPSDSTNVKIPFVIDGGQVVMDTALITNLTAKNFVGETVNADTVNAGVEVNSPSINGGSINGTYLNLDGGGGDRIVLDPTIPGLYGFASGVAMFKLLPGSEYMEIGGGCANGGLTYDKGTLCLPNLVVGTHNIEFNAATQVSIFEGAFTTTYETKGWYRDSLSVNFSASGYPMIVDIYSNSSNQTDIGSKDHEDFRYDHYGIELKVNGNSVGSYVTQSDCFNRFFIEATADGVNGFEFKVSSYRGSVDGYIKAVFTEVKR